MVRLIMQEVCVYRGDGDDGEADNARSVCVYVKGVEVMVRLIMQEVCVCM